MIPGATEDRHDVNKWVVNLNDKQAHRQTDRQTDRQKSNTKLLYITP